MIKNNEEFEERLSSIFYGDEYGNEYGFNELEVLCVTCKKNTICNPRINYGVKAVACDKYIIRKEYIPYMPIEMEGKE